MPIKEILLSTGTPIVKDKLGWRLLYKSGEKINSSIGAGHFGQGIINLSLVERGHHTIASELVFKMAEENIGH